MNVTGTVVSPSMDNIIFHQGNKSTVILGPDNFQSLITLTCSVTNSGSFLWQWMYNGSMLSSGDKFQILIKDATRTSTLTIDTLRSTDSGTYTCITNTYQRQISLLLTGKTYCENKLVILT